MTKPRKPNIPAEAAAFIAEAAGRELARTSLLDCCERLNPKFTRWPQLVLLADLLEQVEAGAEIDGHALDRLMVALCPGSGKSTLLNHAVAFMLARAAIAGREFRVLFVSASQALSERNSRVTRSCFEHPEWPFPEVSLSTESFAAQRWDLMLNGKPTGCGLFAASRESMIRGHRADLIVADDVVPDAGTRVSRQALLDWWNADLMSRGNAGFAVVNVLNRAAVDDLFASLEASEDRWHVVSIPAIAEAGDPLGRKVGAPMPPYTLRELDRRRRMDPLAFEGLYLCRPTPPGGRLFMRSWFESAEKYDPRTPPSCRRVVICVDPASSEKKTADHTAIVVAGDTGTRLVILDVMRGQWSFTRQCGQVLQAFLKWPMARQVRIELAGGGHALRDHLKATTSLPLEGVSASGKGSKGDRASAITHLWETGLVMLPDRASWLADFIEEHTLFSPSIDNARDDQVDAATMALEYLRVRNVCGIMIYDPVAGKLDRMGATGALDWPTTLLATGSKTRDQLLDELAERWTPEGAGLSQVYRDHGFARDPAKEPKRRQRIW